MAHHDPATAQECQGALRRLLISDATGLMTREAAQLVADLVKVRKCSCEAAVVRVLLSLDLSEAEVLSRAQQGVTQCNANLCLC